MEWSESHPPHVLRRRDEMVGEMCVKNGEEMEWRAEVVAVKVVGRDEQGALVRQGWGWQGTLMMLVVGLAALVAVKLGGRVVCQRQQRCVGRLDLLHVVHGAGRLAKS